MYYTNRQSKLIKNTWHKNRGNHQECYARCPSSVSKKGDSRHVPSEASDIFLHPGESSKLVHKTLVTNHFLRRPRGTGVQKAFGKRKTSCNVELTNVRAHAFPYCSSH